MQRSDSSLLGQTTDNMHRTVSSGCHVPAGMSTHPIILLLDPTTLRRRHSVSSRIAACRTSTQLSPKRDELQQSCGASARRVVLACIYAPMRSTGVTEEPAASPPPQDVDRRARVSQGPASGGAPSPVPSGRSAESSASGFSRKPSSASEETQRQSARSPAPRMCWWGLSLPNCVAVCARVGYNCFAALPAGHASAESCSAARRMTSCTQPPPLRRSRTRCQ